MSQATAPCSLTLRARAGSPPPVPSPQTRHLLLTKHFLLFRASAGYHQAAQRLIIPRGHDPGPNSCDSCFLTSLNGAPLSTTDYGWSICQNSACYFLQAILPHSHYLTLRFASRRLKAHLCRDLRIYLTQCMLPFIWGTFVWRQPSFAAVIRLRRASGCNSTCLSRV